MKKFVSLFLGIGLLFLTSTNVSASHSWGNYHWARTNNPFDLNLGDNLASNWDSYLATTSADWSISSVLDTHSITGLSNPKNCRPTNGRVEVCNSKYGNNGWLGVAQIWISGDHITQATTKVNDTYFSRGTYNTPIWRNLVMCQEVGHTLGLDHQDEIFDNPNLNTCMDYTNNPDSNQHPNSHDYEELEIIYTHQDTFTTIINETVGKPGKRMVDLAGNNVDLNNPSYWGQKISDNGRVAEFVRDFGFGNKILTHVIWATE